jgi:hypothetical protein
MNEKAWLFENCILIDLTSKRYVASRAEIFAELKREAGEEILANITTINQYKSNYRWIVGFNKKIDAAAMIGKHFHFRESLFEIEDPNNAVRHSFYTYRLLWLPTGFIQRQQEAIKHFFVDYGAEEVTEIREERCREEGMGHIGNGVARVTVKVRYGECSNNRFEELNGYKTGLGETQVATLILRVGAPMMCLYCRRPGHIRRTCPDLNAFCQNCKRKGHQTETCSYAKRMIAPYKPQNNQDEYEPEGVVNIDNEANPKQPNQDQGKRARVEKSNESTPELTRDAKSSRIEQRGYDAESSDDENSTSSLSENNEDEATEDDLGLAAAGQNSGHTAAGPTSGHSAADEEETPMNTSVREPEVSLDGMIENMKAATTAAGKPTSTTKQKNKSASKDKKADQAKYTAGPTSSGIKKSVNDK